MGLAFVNTFLSMRVSEGFAADLRSKLFSNIQTFSFANLDKLQTSELLVRMTSDVNIVKTSLGMTMRMVFRAPLMLIGSMIMLVVTSPKLALLLLVLLPLILIIMGVFSKRARPLFRRLQERLEKVNLVMQENIAGVRLVRAFVRSDYEKDRFANRNEQYTEKGIQVNRMLAFLMPSMTLVLNLGVAAMLWFGGNMVIGGSLSTGQIVAFLNYLMMTMFPVLLLSMILPQYYAATASLDRVVEVLETQTTLVYPLTSDHRITGGEVAFENVVLDYDGEEGLHEPVLQKISFKVPSGQMVAILGATGSGKTSLINLIPRLYDPTEGRVLIDGVDLKEYTQAELRRNIALALQNAVLFSGTIADNIRFGRPDATDEEVIAAAKAAQAHEFIMSKEGGYQAQVSQRGANFSGGQKQRLAIARALCIHPRLLILDDSTSAVDVETEVDIQKALEKLMKGRTTFVVAQRISTVLRADRILVLDNGQIAADGTHSELIETSPIYQAIYHSQLGDGVLKPNGQGTEEVENA
ncbi:MAG: ABC transporter ATP-binding protein, partial [Anaerolineaceae bacterium]|nr:ABC transporter ATP-binding protein [Anaerolineaceae bacterium]